MSFSRREGNGDKHDEKQGPLNVNEKGNLLYNACICDYEIRPIVFMSRISETVLNTLQRQSPI